MNILVRDIKFETMSPFYLRGKASYANILGESVVCLEFNRSSIT